LSIYSCREDQVWKLTASLTAVVKLWSLTRCTMNTLWFSIVFAHLPNISSQTPMKCLQW